MFVKEVDVLQRQLSINYNSEQPVKFFTECNNTALRSSEHETLHVQEYCPLHPYMGMDGTYFSFTNALMSKNRASLFWLKLRNLQLGLGLTESLGTWDKTYISMRNLYQKLLIASGHYEAKSMKEKRWEVSFPRPVGGRKNFLVAAYLLFTHYT